MNDRWTVVMDINGQLEERGLTADYFEWGGFLGEKAGVLRFYKQRGRKRKPAKDTQVAAFRNVLYTGYTPAAPPPRLAERAAPKRVEPAMGTPEIRKNAPTPLEQRG